MSKSSHRQLHALEPDVRYNSLLVSKFINCLMYDGKKATATRVFYGAMDQIKKRMPDVDPIEVFTAAIENVKPTVEVRCRRVGGANYQVPMQVKPKRQQSLAIRWILAASRRRRPADAPAPGRRTDGRLPPRRRGDEQARTNDQDGRREQGVHPLRLVKARFVNEVNPWPLVWRQGFCYFGKMCGSR